MVTEGGERYLLDVGQRVALVYRGDIETLRERFREREREKERERDGERRREELR